MFSDFYREIFGEVDTKRYQFVKQDKRKLKKSEYVYLNVHRPETVFNLILNKSKKALYFKPTEANIKKIIDANIEAVRIYGKRGKGAPVLEFLIQYKRFADGGKTINYNDNQAANIEAGDIVVRLGKIISKKNIPNVA
jgi:hypothetical protein